MHAYVLFPFYKYSSRATTFKNSVKVVQHISRTIILVLFKFITKVEILYKRARETCRQILSFGMFLGGWGSAGLLP